MKEIETKKLTETPKTVEELIRAHNAKRYQEFDEMVKGPSGPSFRRMQIVHPLSKAIVRR